MLVYLLLLVQRASTKGAAGTQMLSLHVSTCWYRHLEYNCSAHITVRGIDMHKLHVSQLAMCQTLQDQAVQWEQISSGQEFVVLLLCMKHAISASKDHQTMHNLP
ncbi:TPA: hypothetical protein ACH3X3_004713 [Trebouxia sp. C0006]